MAAGQPEKGSARRPSRLVRNAILFACIAAGWVALDQLTKAAFERAGAAGATELIPGVVGFKLVHNTGGAWGSFDGMTIALAIFSLVICAAILIYLFFYAPDSSSVLACGLALVFAGGIGNIIDRFTVGYVIDFIQPLFIDFPVFNVADIGVTCGIAIALVSIFASGMREEAQKGCG